MSPLPTSPDVEAMVAKCYSTLAVGDRALLDVRLAQHRATAAEYAPLVAAVREWQEASAEKEDWIKLAPGLSPTTTDEERWEGEFHARRKRVYAAEQAILAFPLPSEE